MKIKDKIINIAEGIFNFDKEGKGTGQKILTAKQTLSKNS